MPGQFLTPWVTRIGLCASLITLSACSYYQQEYRFAKKNIPLMHMPESVALIRFDYIDSQPDRFMEIDYEEEYYEEDHHHEDDSFFSPKEILGLLAVGLVADAIVDEIKDEDKSDKKKSKKNKKYAEASSKNDSSGTDIDPASEESLESDVAGFGEINNASNITESTIAESESNPIADAPNQHTARRETNMPAGPVRLGTVEYAEQHKAAMLYMDQLTYDQAYGRLVTHLIKQYNIPLSHLDAARDYVPYDEIGFPLGEIKPSSIPPDAEAGLAVALDIGYGSLMLRKGDEDGRKEWRTKIKIYLEMIDKQGNVLWSQHIEHTAAMKNTAFYDRNDYRRVYEEVRRAGPDIDREIALAFSKISFGDLALHTQ